MFAIQGTHLWAAAACAPVGFAAGFGAAWAAGHVIAAQFSRKGYVHGRRRRH